MYKNNLYIKKVSKRNLLKTNQIRGTTSLAEKYLPLNHSYHCVVRLRELSVSGYWRISFSFTRSAGRGYFCKCCLPPFTVRGSLKTRPYKACPA